MFGIDILDWISFESGIFIAGNNSISIIPEYYLDQDTPTYTGIEFYNIDFKGTIHIPFWYN